MTKTEKVSFNRGTDGLDGVEIDGSLKQHAALERIARGATLDIVGENRGQIV